MGLCLPFALADGRGPEAGALSMLKEAGTKVSLTKAKKQRFKSRCFFALWR